MNFANFLPQDYLTSLAIGAAIAALAPTVYIYLQKLIARIDDLKDRVTDRVESVSKEVKELKALLLATVEEGANVKQGDAVTVDAVKRRARDIVGEGKDVIDALKG